MKALRRAAIAVALAVLGYGALLSWVWWTSRQDERVSADTIVVLGAAQYNGRPSPVLRARLDHALQLYRLGLAKILVVTGGIGTGDRVSEATVGHRYLRQQSVPDSALVVRADGRTTAESMHSVAEWMAERELTRVLLVSDPFHMFRLRMEARRTNIEAYTSPTEDSPISDNPVLELRYLFAEGFKIPVAWFRAALSPLTSHSRSL